MPLSDEFDRQITAAIVRQFFENPPVLGNLPDGTPFNIPGRPTPVQVVAARLLAEKNEQLLTAIMAAIDLDALAALVAAEVSKTLTQSDSPYDYRRELGAGARKALKERVDSRLVELLAQQMFADMQAAGAVADAGAIIEDGPQ